MEIIENWKKVKTPCSCKCAKIIWGQTKKKWKIRCSACASEFMINK